MNTSSYYDPADDILSQDYDEVTDSKRCKFFDERLATISDNLSISQDIGPGCGGRVWESASVLCRYLDQRSKEEAAVREETSIGLYGNVLELG